MSYKYQVRGRKSLFEYWEKPLRTNMESQAIMMFKEWTMAGYENVILEFEN